MVMIRIFNQYVSPKNLLLMLLESAVIVGAVLCAVRLRFWNHPEEISTYILYPDFIIQSAVVLVVCLMCFYYNDLYDARTGFGSAERLLRIEQSVGAASLVLGTVYFMIPELLLGRGVFLIAMVLVTTCAFLDRKLVDRVWQRASAQQIVILGAGKLATDVARELTLRNDLRITLNGFISCATGGEHVEMLAGLPVLGTAADMEAIAAKRQISRIIVALEDRRGALPTRDLVTLRVRGVHVEDAATALAALTGRISLWAVRPSWFAFSDGFRRSKWNEFVKRVLDMAAGIIGLVLSLPVMAAVAMAIRLDSRGPAIYRQTRVGRTSRPFELLKFRSMRVDAERELGAQWAVEDDPRVTRVGRILRKYRLDELPQFWNVIRGDMSFVGPRPERPVFVEELRKVIPYYDHRHSARPGITGWAQVQYRYGATVEDAISKLEYDLFYLKNTSLMFDLAIIFQTVRIVLGGHGAR
jgi:sugar transferase (PEP-CTERM system associated)